MNPKDNGTTTPEGVFWQSEQAARICAERHDKDVVEVDGGWLAKNRQTSKGAMPTKNGDVVVYHLNQLFRVWVVTEDGAQQPDANVAPNEVWNHERGSPDRPQMDREDEGTTVLASEG